MKRCVAILPLVLTFGIVLMGCDQPAPVASGTKTSGPPAPPPPPGSESPPAAPAPAVPAAAAPTQPALPIETKVGVFAGSLDDLAAPTNAPQPQPAPPPPVGNTEVVKAGKGVGAAGRSLDQYEGVVVTPVKALFSARERAFFEAEFPKNYQLWEASGNETPKNFDDLKAQFLDPLGLTRKLPVLPQGQKYVWNPETKELGVERPRKQ